MVTSVPWLITYLYLDIKYIHEIICPLTLSCLNFFLSSLIQLVTTLCIQWLKKTIYIFPLSTSDSHTVTHWLSKMSSQWTLSLYFICHVSVSLYQWPNGSLACGIYSFQSLCLFCSRSFHPMVNSKQVSITQDKGQTSPCLLLLCSTLFKPNSVPISPVTPLPLRVHSGRDLQSGNTLHFQSFCLKCSKFFS